MAIGRIMSNDAHKLRKSCEALLGICAGILADGQINEGEVRFLDLWLKDNPGIADVWPGEVVAKRIREILSDNIITTEELAHLKNTLTELIGGTLQDTGSTAGLSTRLPLNDDRANPIIFDNTAFCFTGNFIFGTRAACERAVEQRGAMAFGNITANLEYLVVGTMVSADWANTSHGRKIEKAIEYQNKGYRVLIISEEHWVKNL